MVIFSSSYVSNRVPVRQSASHLDLPHKSSNMFEPFFKNQHKWISKKMFDSFLSCCLLYSSILTMQYIRLTF